MNKTLKAIIKYVIIAAVGIALFGIVSQSALPERPRGGIGGDSPESEKAEQKN